MRRWTDAWSCAVNAVGKRLDPHEWDIFFVPKVNVQNAGVLLVSTDRLHQASVPVLHHTRPMRTTLSSDFFCVITTAM